MTVHTFKEEKKKGDVGENLLVNTYDELTWFEESYASDVYYNGNLPVEIKTDYYTMEKTHNFFIERISVDRDGSPGGPWQAFEKGSKVFIYFFINNGRLFVFNNLPALIERVEGLVSEYSMTLCSVKNKGYNTMGYKIPRGTLSDLYTEIALGEALPNLLSEVNHEC